MMKKGYLFLTLSLIGVMYNNSLRADEETTDETSNSQSIETQLQDISEKIDSLSSINNGLHDKLNTILDEVKELSDGISPFINLLRKEAQESETPLSNVNAIAAPEQTTAAISDVKPTPPGEPLVIPTPEESTTIQSEETSAPIPSAEPIAPINTTPVLPPLPAAPQLTESTALVTPSPVIERGPSLTIIPDVESAYNAQNNAANLIQPQQQIPQPQPQVVQPAIQYQPVQPVTTTVTEQVQPQVQPDDQSQYLDLSQLNQEEYDAYIKQLQAEGYQIEFEDQSGATTQ